MKLLAFSILALTATTAFAQPVFTGVATHYKRRTAPWGKCPEPFTEQDLEAVKEEAKDKAFRACREATNGVCILRKVKIEGPCGCGWATNSCIGSATVEAVD